jgi:multiple sugar transport system substrate-binding protein
MARRKLGCALAAVFFALVCLSQAEAKPIKLTLWSGYPDLQGFYETAAKEFTAQNPDITVEIQTFALADLDKKLGMSIPSKTSADILELISLYSFPWAQKYFAEVPADVKKSAMAVINKAYLHDVLYGDKMMGLPFCFYSEVLYYNKDMLAEAGFKAPPDTIEQFVDYATKLTKRDADGNVTRSGLSMRFAGNPSGTCEKFWAFGLMPFGGDILAQSAKKPGKYHNGFDNDAGYKAMSLYLDLIYNRKVTDFNIKQDSDAFAQGKAAMFEREQYVVGTLKKAAPDLNYGASALPKGSQRGTFAITRNMFVPKACKEQAAAWKFVSFFYSKPMMERMVSETGWLSTRADLDYKTLLKDSPQLLAGIDNPPDLQFIWQKRLTIENGIMTKMGEELTKLFRDQSLAGNEAKTREAMHKLGIVVDDMLKDSGLYAE